MNVRRLALSELTVGQVRGLDRATIEYAVAPSVQGVPGAATATLLRTERL
ncbi:hypothetical protein ACFQZZ_14070 [Nocardia sp. GCM10030253]